jgi:NADH dehydrogenase/NADH:ubiquinone oxidoreductase 75 kD subunit (chain G)
MSELIHGHIDGREVRVDRGAMALTAARELGLAVPTLCHHPGLPDEGSCRLCLVEIGGRLVASCMYPMREDGFQMLTDSPAIRQARAFVLELLVNRCPSSPRLLALAYEYGVEPESRFQANDGNLCIRCGRCTRACEANGITAISLVGRGWARKVTGPFFQPPETCIGCLACASVCPTGHIHFTEAKGHRSIWGRDFELIHCPACGKMLGTAEQLSWLGLEPGPCPGCRHRETAKGLRKACPSEL